MKLLPCGFLDDVLCSWRKTEKFNMMARCESCEHYKWFLREMDEEDEKVMDGIDEIHRLRARYERGEISLEAFRKAYFRVQSE